MPYAIIIAAGRQPGYDAERIDRARHGGINREESNARRILQGERIGSKEILLRCDGFHRRRFLHPIPRTRFFCGAAAFDSSNKEREKESRTKNLLTDVFARNISQPSTGMECENTAAAQHKTLQRRVVVRLCKEWAERQEATLCRFGIWPGVTLFQRSQKQSAR